MLVSSGDLLMVPGFTVATSDFSVEFWYKSSDPLQYAPILGNPFYNTTTALGIYIDSGSFLQVSTNSSGSNISYSLPTPLQANTWTYFAISRSGTTESVWVDGIASPQNSQSDGRNYSDVTNSIFNTGGLLGTANVTNIKVNVGVTLLDPTLSTITVPTNSLTKNGSDTKLLMNTLNAASVFSDTSNTQSSITVNSGSVTYQVDSPYL
jgi:hypothetical protein